MKTFKLALGISFAFILVLLSSCKKEEVVTVGSIQGIVTNASNNEPIQGVNISLSPMGLSAVTGSDGRYEFKNLQAGQYTVQGVKAGFESNTKNITIVAGNVSSGDMTLTPEVADFKLNVDYLDFGSAFSQLNFKIINVSNSLPISWTITESLNWLTATPSTGTLNAGQEVSVLVDIDRTILDQNISANINIEAGDKTIVLPINVTVSGSDGPNLQLSETTLDFGSSANSLAFYVMNTGPEGTSLNWTCSNVNVDWLSLNPTSGHTAGGASTAVMATIDRTKFEGVVSTAVTVSGAGSSSTITITASTSGSGSPILQLSEGSLGFGENETTLSFLVKNVGSAGTVLDWTIEDLEVDWLTLTPMTGHTNSGSGAQVTAAVDRTKFTGTVNTTVKVNSQNNSASLSVSAVNKQPLLEVSTETVSFGSISTNQSFTIKNAGDEGTSLQWRIEAPTAEWLTVSPLTGNLNAGSTKTVNLTVDRTKFTGDVSATLQVKAGSQSASVLVTATTAQAVMTITPTSVDFGKTGTTKTFTIKNEGEEGSVLNYSIANPTVDWLTVSPATGSINANATKVVTLTLDRTKFDGDVSTTLQVTAGEQNIGVTVTASTGQPNLLVTPTTVDFGKLNSTKTITVKNNGEEGSVLNWTIAQPTVTWLSVSTLTGNINANASTNVTLTIDRSLFDGDVSTTLIVTAGTQSATVSITASTAQYELEVTPVDIDFGTISNTKTFTVKNTGETGSNMVWNIEALGVNWLAASPMSGNLSANQSTTVTLTLDRTKFTGNVSANVEIIAGTQSATVAVAAATPVPSMTVSPTSVDFGTISTSQQITISNTGEAGSVLNYSIESPSVNWLTVTPASGTINANLNTTVNLIIDRNAFMGVQNTNLYITGAGTTVTLPITVDNTVLAVDGLIAYYTFDDGSVNDWGGHYNGVNNNAVAVQDAPSNSGFSMEFNGSNAYLQIPYPIFQTGTTWSYNLWIKTGTNNCCLLGTNDGYAYISINSNSHLYVDSHSGFSGWTSAQSLTSYLNNQWHMLTITYNIGVLAVYLDGVFFESYNTTSYAWFSSYSTTYLGAKKSGSSMFNYFNGKMDNIRTYNRALTQAEVTAIYNAGQ